MKKQVLHITSALLIERICEVINDLPTDGTVDVIIQEHNENRSLAQNRLMWLWHGVFGKHVGIHKDQVHRDFKRTFVMPILLRDDEDGVLKILVDHAHQSSNIADRFYDLIHTRDMSVGQLSEALEEYDHWAGSNGIPFPHPDDSYLM